MNMDRGTKETIIAVIVATMTVTAVFSGLFIYSGHWPPFSVVESGSMQHSENSTLTTIDTGDMVVVRTPDKVTIRSYVDGYKEGYSKFGSYGDVIVYERAGGNPVIHRAVLWLEWNAADRVWVASSLDGFSYWECWDNGVKIEDYTKLKGILTISNYGHTGETIYLSLETLSDNPKSGYATKGDNNRSFDYAGCDSEGRLTGQIEGVSGLISSDDILYVAGFTIPWIGIIKLYLSGNDRAKASIPANSITDLILAIIVLIALVLVIIFLPDNIRKRKSEK